MQNEYDIMLRKFQTGQITETECEAVTVKYSREIYEQEFDKN